MKFADFQASSTFELDGKTLTACEKCRMDYADKNPPVTPCSTCRVDLQRENEDAARIFQIVRGQQICKWNGERDIAVDLNHLAVWAAIDAYGVRDRTGCFEKVLNLFHQRLREQDNGAD